MIATVRYTTYVVDNSMHACMMHEVLVPASFSSIYLVCVKLISDQSSEVR